MAHPPSPNIGPYVITTQDIYTELLGLRSDARQIDRRLAVMEYRNQLGDTRATDYELRLRTLERFRWILLGAVIATSALGSIVTTLLTTRP